MSKPRPSPRARSPVLWIFLLVFVLATAIGYLWKRTQAPSLPAASAVVDPVPLLPARPALPASVPTATPPTAAGIASAPLAIAPPLTRPEPQPDTRPAPRPETRPEPRPEPPPRPRLRTWVVYADQEIPTDQGKISLPTGARFAIKLRASVDGSVDFYTINPKGVVSTGPLWSAPLEKQRSLVGPMLRLQGTTGLETIRLQFKPKQGGPLVVQHVQIWHLGSR